MGYRGGAPSWVYKNQLASQSASYQHQISTMNEKIKQLQDENDNLKNTIKKLEKEIKKLKE
ncbi:MAG: hypothetical protein NWE88_12755 [Candidatus Bathyarchaeota archaeon]|nr:hypothetical protein [Candidatus Bathyarchaeota archaeon]